MLTLLLLLLAQPVLASTPPANYAIDANGEVIDLTGYSRRSRSPNRPLRIDLNVENFYEQQQPLHHEFRQPNPWGNPVQWENSSGNKIPYEHWSLEAENTCPSPIRSD